MKPKMVMKDPTKRVMPLETVKAPLSLGGDEGDLASGVTDSEGEEGVVDGVVGDGVVGVGVDGVGVVGVGDGVVLEAATTLICTFMPPELVQ